MYKATKLTFVRLPNNDTQCMGGDAVNEALFIMNTFACLLVEHANRCLIAVPIDS